VIGDAVYENRYECFGILLGEILNLVVIVEKCKFLQMSYKRVLLGVVYYGSSENGHHNFEIRLHRRVYEKNSLTYATELHRKVNEITETGVLAQESPHDLAECPNELKSKSGMIWK